MGDRFMAELLQRLNEISEHPHYYGFIDEKHVIRDVKLKSFPYLIVYEVEGGCRDYLFGSLWVHASG